MPVTILLKLVRNSRGISQLELAQLSKVSYGYISELENGKKIPSIDILCRLAKALECRPEDLYKCED